MSFGASLRVFKHALVYCIFVHLVYLSIVSDHPRAPKLNVGIPTSIPSGSSCVPQEPACPIQMLTSTTAAKVRAHRKVTVVAGNVRHESIKTLPIMGGRHCFSSRSCRHASSSTSSCRDQSSTSFSSSSNQDLSCTDLKNQGHCSHSEHGADIKKECPVSCGVCTGTTRTGDGGPCSVSSSCSSGVCRGGNCCNAKGRSDGCSDCDSDGDCSICTSGYTKKSYECFATEHYESSAYSCKSDTTIFGTADVRLSNGLTDDTGYSWAQCDKECTDKSACQSFVYLPSNG